MRHFSDFTQMNAQLKNQFQSDELLKSLLEIYLPENFQKEVTTHLTEVGEDAVGKLLQWSSIAEMQEPLLKNFDPFGKRIDEIEMSSSWRNIEAYAATHGVVASGYERKQNEFSRIYQLALLYLFHPSSAFVSCPLAMTDGAAKLIENYGDEQLKNKAFKHLTSRDPNLFWTSGQWMTEKAGGSDVGLTQTVAKKAGDHYQLHGIKFFTSATTSPMAMTLARIEGHETGGKGLSLFYLEVKNSSGQLQNIQIQRLKDKLGTRAMPTAELELSGTPASLVGGEGHGVKKIATLFNITRIYNSICSVAQMRRALALAEDYSLKRVAFGKPVHQHPLFQESFQTQFSEFSGCLHLIFKVAQLLGKSETSTATQDEQALLRLLTPIAKLFTGKTAVQVVSEMVEVFAGVGYCEDSGIPKLIRDAQVFPIWEGTTDVLSLDVLRALKKECSMDLLIQDMSQRLEKLADSNFKRELIDQIQELHQLGSHLTNADDSHHRKLRYFSFAIARVYICSLLLETGLDRSILKRWQFQAGEALRRVV